MDARTYRTTNLELGSTIKAVEKIDPGLTFDAQGIATLEFPMSQGVTDVVLRYESGILVDARTILTVRNQLYRRVREGRQ